MHTPYNLTDKTVVGKVAHKLVVQWSPCKNESFTHKLKSSFLRNIGLMLHESEENRRKMY